MRWNMLKLRITCSPVAELLTIPRTQSERIWASLWQPVLPTKLWSRLVSNQFWKLYKHFIHSLFYPGLSPHLTTSQLEVLGRLKNFKVEQLLELVLNIKPATHCSSNLFHSLRKCGISVFEWKWQHSFPSPPGFQSQLPATKNCQWSLVLHSEIMDCGPRTLFRQPLRVYWPSSILKRALALPAQFSSNKTLVTFRNNNMWDPMCTTNETPTKYYKYTLWLAQCRLCKKRCKKHFERSVAFVLRSSSQSWLAEVPSDHFDSESNVTSSVCSTVQPQLMPATCLAPQRKMPNSRTTHDIMTSYDVYVFLVKK